MFGFPVVGKQDTPSRNHAPAGEGGREGGSAELRTEPTHLNAGKCSSTKLDPKPLTSPLVNMDSSTLVAAATPSTLGR